MRAIAAAAVCCLLILSLGCATTGAPNHDVGKGWSCAFVAIEMERCSKSLETRDGYCQAAVLLSTSLCAGPPTMSLVAASAAPSGAPGTGYRPTSTRACHRSFPGGPETVSTANWTAPDPWDLSCAGSPDALRCLRNDGFLDYARPGVAGAYQARYGFSWTDNLGGWCGKSSEAASRVGEALSYFCATAPGRISSGGAAAGWDCIATGREVVDSLANREADRIAKEFCLATEGTPDCSPAPTIDPPKPVVSCDPPFVCSEPCACPDCPPPCHAPTLSPQSTTTLGAVCEWIPPNRPQRRRLCMSLREEIKTLVIVGDEP